MQDKELYKHLLGIEKPWTVSRVELNIAEQRVDVWVEHAGGKKWECPECGQKYPLYDHSPERAWRHLDSCQFFTYLHARTPRVDCSEHGVKQVKLPWAEPNSRFTAMFERLAIDVLKETNISGATQILRISWDEAWHLVERAVRRGREAKQSHVVCRVGVDEKAIAKGHKYLTLVCDLDESTVEYVEKERRAETLDKYFETLTEEQLEGIEAIAIDMWDPYIKSIRKNVPDADNKIVFDRFHIMKQMNKAVDIVRKQEHRKLRKEGDETLTRTKYLWLYSWENVPECHYARFEELRDTELKTARAWAIKENLRYLWSYNSKGWAERFWKKWYWWATHSRLAPVITVARILKRHIENVMTYFKHRITNSVSEGLNSKIGTVKNMASGFRNAEHFKTAIYFHCGGLQLYPDVPGTHKDPG